MQDNLDTEEQQDSYKATSDSTATKLDLTPRETPQSISVITRQQLDDQGATGIADVLRRAPGISVQNYDSERWEFSSRGAPITNFQYDGVNTDYDGVYDYGTTSTDMATFDRVEIIKGEYEGIQVPRSAIRFKELEETSTNVLTGEETTTKVNYRGVYVMDGETVTFRKLDVIYEGDDYVLSSLNAGDGYLILYDSIIVEGIDVNGE